MSDLDIALYIDGRLADAEREGVEAHLAACDDCRAVMVQTSEFIARARRRRTITTVLFAGALAASVLLLAVPRGRLAPRSRGDLFRGPASGSLVAYGPIGSAGASTLRFAWESAPGALSYRVTVSSASGRIFTASTTDTTVTLPDSVRLQPGVRYLWSVDALISDGRSRTTGLREFTRGP